MTAATHEAKLSQSQQRVAEIDTAISKLDRQFEELAGGFETGDEGQLRGGRGGSRSRVQLQFVAAIAGQSRTAILEESRGPPAIPACAAKSCALIIKQARARLIPERIDVSEKPT